MPKPIKVNYVHAWCMKHKATTEHIEYIMDDKTVKYKCRECYKERPYEYPLYGRQQQKLDIPKREEPKWGREVA